MKSNYQYLFLETWDSGSGTSVDSEFLSPDIEISSKNSQDLLPGAPRVHRYAFQLIFKIFTCFNRLSKKWFFFSNPEKYHFRSKNRGKEKKIIFTLFTTFFRINFFSRKNIFFPFFGITQIFFCAEIQKIRSIWTQIAV